MYSIEQEKEYQKAIQQQAKNLKTVATAKIVFSDEDSALFVEGIKELQGMRPEEIDKISDLSADEMKAKWDSKPVQAAIATMAKAITSSNDALIGKTMSNTSLQMAAKQMEKSFHGVGNIDLTRAILELDTNANAFQNADVDASWMSAFRMVDARGRDKISVRDLLGTMRFYELKAHEPALLTNLGDETKSEIKWRRFGGGFAFDTYDMNNNIWTANDLLNGIRLADLEMKAQVAYREIFIKDSAEVAQAKITKVTGGSTGKDTNYNETYNAIHTLNEAARKMKEDAMQVRDAGNQKKTKRTEARLMGVTATSPILVYYHASHADLINRIRRMSGGDDGINVQLLHNFVFIGTYMAPISGGYTFTGSEDRDEFGIFGSVAEYASVSSKGVKLVLPGERNLYGVFSDLRFGQTTRAESESSVVVGFTRYNCAVDVRQKVHVTLV